MIQLRFLGGIVLERDEAPVTGRPAQRHHVALLAILAASPGQTASRDKLIAYLWPERETSRARHRLSVALHVLRGGLGEECLVTSGDAVTLNPEGIRADVTAFQEAFLAGRLEEAVELYAGPFLDGFFLSGAPGFERWVETEREHLAGMYRAALEGLIAEAEGRGDARAAARWWRRLAAEVPHSAPVAVGLIRALAAAGDVTEALLHARAHVALVQAEFELPPDPRVLELVSQLQREAEARPGSTLEDRGDLPAVRGARAVPPPVGGSTASAGPASPSAGEGPRFSRRRSLLAAGLVLLAVLAGWGIRGDASGGEPGAAPSVAVRPFAEVGSGPGSAALGDALAERVAETLAFVPGLDVRSAGVAPARAGGPVGGEVSPGGEAGAVVEGEIRLEGDEWRVTARLVDGGSGRIRWTETWDRPAGDEAVLLEELSLTIADAFRLRVAPYEPKSYTESRRAYDRFLRGVHAQRRLTAEDTWAALQFYREAWEEDPGFALAHAIAGNAYIALSQLGLSPEIGLEMARQQVELALELDSTLAEGHAALGQLQIWSEGDFDAGERSLRRAIMLYPTLPQARSWYGWYALEVRGWNDAAVASVRRALEVDPLNTARSYALEWMLYRARRYDEVEEQNRVTMGLGPEVARGFPDSPLGHAYRELGRYEDALAEFRALDERSEGPPPAGLALTYVRMNREAEARAILGELEAVAERQEGSPMEVARIHAALGDLDAAFLWLERAFERGPEELFSLRSDPRLDPVRGDPRYDELLRRVGLP